VFGELTSALTAINTRPDSTPTATAVIHLACVIRLDAHSGAAGVFVLLDSDIAVSIESLHNFEIETGTLGRLSVVTAGRRVRSDAETGNPLIG
jgi:hypothetical protein